MTLRIAPELTLPDEAVVQTFGVLAKRGSGKTYFAAVLAEEMIQAGHTVVILDVVGVFWGLRSSADGTGPGLPVFIVGGEHGDLPLAAGAGAFMADTIIETRRPIVLDVSLFTKSQQRTFVTDFAERLYQRNRDPLHLIIDEADAFCPQRIAGGDERMFGSIDAIIRRGRARGLGATLISQRPAVLHKDVLTQIEVLMALRLVGPQDRDAIAKWIDVQAQDRERAKVMLESLPSLPIGEAWVWSPGWLDLWKRIKVRTRLTFDSSATPKPGARRTQPTNLAAVDLEELRAKMSAFMKEKAADDPKLLRARIEELEAELACDKAHDLETQLTDLEAELADRSLGLAVARELVAKISALEEGVSQLAQEAKNVVARLGGFESQAEVEAAAAPKRPALQLVTPPKEASAAPASSPPRTAAPSTGISKAERAILSVLAWATGSLSPTQIAIRAGYTHSGGGFRNAMGALRSRGWIEGYGHVTLTRTGREAGAPFDPVLRGAQLVALWQKSLGRAERLILESVVQAHPKVVSISTVAARTGYEASGGGFRNALGHLRSLKLIDGRNELRASQELVS